MDKVAGLMVDVIGSDCTGGGVTSGADRAILVWPGMIDDYDRVFAPREGVPLLEVEVDEEPRGLRAGYLVVHKGQRTPRGMMSEYRVGTERIVRVRVKPYGREPGMFGGHFVVTSDSRFPFSGPVPVFDRYEGERERLEAPSAAKVLDGEAIEEERPGHDAPMPTRENHTPEDFERALKLYMEGAAKLRHDWKREGRDEVPPMPVMGIEPGPKMLRITIDDGQKAVYSFVERATGDVYKAESYRKPAKHVRGNIFSPKHGLERHNWFGPEYLR